VICSNLAGAACLITEKNGIVFNPYDKEELLTIFCDVLCRKQSSINEISTHLSLMPYTFHQKVNELISFLNDEESTAKKVS